MRIFCAFLCGVIFAASPFVVFAQGLVCTTFPEGTEVKEETKDGQVVTRIAYFDKPTCVEIKEDATSEIFTLSSDNKMLVTSHCGVAGSYGTVVVSMPGSGEKPFGTRALSKQDNKKVIQEACATLNSSDPKKTMMSLMQAYQGESGLDIELTRNQVAGIQMSSGLERALAAGGYTGAWRDGALKSLRQSDPERVEKFLEAIARGDAATPRNMLVERGISPENAKKIADTAVQMYKRNPQSIISALPAGTHIQPLGNAAYFCGLDATGDCRTGAPVSVTGFQEPAGRQTFGGQVHGNGLGTPSPNYWSGVVSRANTPWGIQGPAPIYQSGGSAGANMLGQLFQTAVSMIQQMQNRAKSTSKPSAASVSTTSPTPPTTPKPPTLYATSSPTTTPQL